MRHRRGQGLAVASYVNALTTRTLFTFSLTQANQDNRAFLVLDPFTSSAK